MAASVRFPPIADIRPKSQSDGMSAFGRQFVTGTALSVASIAMLFWWGFHFDLFGQKIQLDLPRGGFFLWMVAAAFGGGYAVGGWRTGAAWSGGLLVALGGALLLGLALGNYG